MTLALTALLALPAAAPAVADAAERVEVAVRFTAGWTPSAPGFPLGWDCDLLIAESAPPHFQAVCRAPDDVACADPALALTTVGPGDVSGRAACHGDASTRPTATCLADADAADADVAVTCADADAGTGGTVFFCEASPRDGVVSLANVHGEARCAFRVAPPS